MEASEWQSGIEVNLTPLGTFLLFGVPMEALSNRVVALDDLLGGAAARLLTERLHEARDGRRASSSSTGSSPPVSRASAGRRRMSRGRGGG
jgi:hypothetical protein